MRPVLTWCRTAPVLEARSTRPSGRRTYHASERTLAMSRTLPEATGDAAGWGGLPRRPISFQPTPPGRFAPRANPPRTAPDCSAQPLQDELGRRAPVRGFDSPCPGSGALLQLGRERNSSRPPSGRGRKEAPSHAHPPRGRPAGSPPAALVRAGPAPLLRRAQRLLHQEGDGAPLRLL